MFQNLLATAEVPWQEDSHSFAGLNLTLLYFRNLEDPQDCDLSTSSRGCKGKKGKHKESAYTGNPLSPKMGGNGKRGTCNTYSPPWTSTILIDFRGGCLSYAHWLETWRGIFGYFLKLFDIQNGHFVELILRVHIGQSCLKLIKVAFWQFQRQILLISKPFWSVCSPCICWYMALNVLEKSLNVRNLERMFFKLSLKTLKVRYILSSWCLGCSKC